MRESEATALAGGEPAGGQVGEVVEIDGGKRGGDVQRAAAEIVAPERHGLGDGQRRLQRVLMTEIMALRGHAEIVDAALQRQASGGRVDQAGNGAQQR